MENNTIRELSLEEINAIGGAGVSCGGGIGGGLLYAFTHKICCNNSDTGETTCLQY